MHEFRQSQVITSGESILGALVLGNSLVQVLHACNAHMQASPLLEALPKEAYTALPFVLAPVLSNPIAMAAHKAIGESSPLAQFTVRVPLHAVNFAPSYCVYSVWGGCVCRLACTAH